MLRLANIAEWPLYAAPEMFLGGEISSRSDVYSVGVLLFRMLTGLFPVEGDTVAAIRQAHRESHRRRLADLRSDLPTPLVAAIDTALSPNPANRHVSIGVMADALEKVPLGVGATLRASSRRRVLWLAAATVLAVGAGVLTSVSRGGVPSSRVGGSIAVPSEGVLVASFVNATGDRDLDEVIADLVERDLGRSQRIRLIGRERVEDVLRLMRKPVETGVFA